LPSKPLQRRPRLSGRRSSYIFRAYHALPPLNRKSDGLQVNAVLGFCNMLWKLLRDMPADNRPTHLAIVFMKSEITFRKSSIRHKAHRRRRRTI
jgi:DNA polymerase-1